MFHGHDVTIRTRLDSIRNGQRGHFFRPEHFGTSKLQLYITVKLSSTADMKRPYHHPGVNFLMEVLQFLNLFGQ